jgi:hypothetical protein
LWRRLKGPLLLFAMVAGMFWKLVFTRQYTWLNSPELAGLVLPWFQLQAANLHRWSLTLWDPYQWCGQPLAAQGQAGTLYPLNWLLWALPLHRTWVRHVYLNWYFVLIHFQGALFAYWLCRDQKRSRTASLLGGIAFAFGPLLGTNAWPSALNAAVWAPLQLMFFLRAARNVRPLFSAAACGAMLGASWLSGSDEIPILLSMAFAALWLWQGFRSGAWKPPAMAAASAFGVGAMQILPGLEYLAYRPHVWAAQAAAAWQSHAAGPLSLVNLMMPGAGDPALFIGTAVLAFAAVGIRRFAGQPSLRICLWLGAAGLALAAGPYTMFGGALYGMRLLWRDPHSALCLLALSLPLPAAAGLDGLRDGAQSVTLRRVLLAIAILCGLGLFMLLLVAGDDLDKLAPLALCGLGALLTFALLEAHSRGAISARAASVCGILLAMWQFGHVTGMDWRNIELGWPYLNRLSESASIAALLRSQTSPVRIANPDRSAGFDLGEWQGVEQFDGLTGGTENVMSVADLPTAQALAGVGLRIAAKAPGEPAFQTASGLKLYAQSGAFPRAWIVSRVSGVKNALEARSRLGQPFEAFKRAAFVAGEPPALAPCDRPGSMDEGAIDQISRRGRKLTVQAKLACAGMVVISQTFYPGWRAFVDGRPAKIYETDGFLDGVAAPPGKHAIELIYEPWTIPVGAAISALSAVLLIVAYRRGNIRNAVADSGASGLT